jgi:hypothetical protein
MSLIISANADAVLAVARSQAIRFGHEFVSRDHVLFAILLSNLGGFMPWLEDRGLALNAVELRLLAIPRPEPRRHYGLMLSPVLREILSEIIYSRGVSMAFPDEPLITTRRLLAGLLCRAKADWPGGLPSQVMITAGKTIEDLEAAIAELKSMEEKEVQEKVEREPQRLDMKEI